jgi:hypothetical protein
MNEVINTTDEEKIEMYDKLEKSELIKMLIEANKHLDRLTKNKKPILVDYINSFQRLDSLKSFEGMGFTDEELNEIIEKFDMFETDEGDGIAIALTNYTTGKPLPDCGKFYWDEEKSLFTFKLY